MNRTRTENHQLIRQWYADTVSGEFKCDFSKLGLLDKAFVAGTGIKINEINDMTTSCTSPWL